MTAELSTPYRMKWMRHFSRATPFLLYSGAKDSLLVCVVNVLLLRRKLQINAEKESVSFEEICSMITPLVKRAQPEWTLNTLKKMHQGVRPDCFMNSLRVELEEDVAKLLDMLAIPVFHGCVAAARYRNIEHFTYDDVRYQLMLYQRGQRMEGVRFEEAEAQVAEAFLQKHHSRLTEKGLQLLKAEFTAKDNTFHAIYHQNRYRTLTCTDDTFYTLMADAVYEAHSCIWEQLESPVCVDERFKPYKLEPGQIKEITPLSTPRPSGDATRTISMRSGPGKRPLVANVNERVDAPTADGQGQGKGTEESAKSISESTLPAVTEEAAEEKAPVTEEDGSVEAVVQDGSVEETVEQEADGQGNAPVEDEVTARDEGNLQEESSARSAASGAPEVPPLKMPNRGDSGKRCPAGSNSQGNSGRRSQGGEGGTTFTKCGNMGICQLIRSFLGRPKQP